MRAAWPWVATGCAAWAFLLAGTVRAAAGPTAPAAPSAADIAAANNALAERLYSLGRGQVAPDATSKGRQQQAANLMLEAARLNPTEPRFPRLAGQAFFDAQDLDGAVAAVKAERALVPDDRVVQVRQMELYALRMQSVDAKIKYLEQILSTEAIPAEVRAVAAGDEAELYRERSDPAHVASSLDLATRLDALNIRIRSLALATSGASWTPAIQFSNLNAMLRCNPARVDVMTAIARMLAQNALVDPAFTVYDQAVKVSERLGGGIPIDLAREWAAEMFIDGKTDDAAAVMEHFLQDNPGDFDGWLIRLAIEKKRDKAGSFDKVRASARVAFLTTLASAGQAIAKAATQTSAGASGAPTTSAATTGPATINISDDVARLAKLNNPNLTTPYLSIVGNVAWFLVYFDQDPAAAQQIITAVEPLVSSGDISVTRLQGWVYLDSGQADAARTKLAAVSDRDPLAQLGLLQMDRADSSKKDAVIAQAKRLVTQYPAGPTGAILVSALGDLSGPVAASPNAGPVVALLGDFPMDLIRILDVPQEFYQVTAEPIRTSYAFGDPILVKVTVRNIGKYDLFVDPDGVLRPELWFDADFSGYIQKTLHGVATDRLTGRMVLHHGETMSQTMRLDDGPIGSILNSSPTAVLQVNLSVTTNPMRAANNVTVPGPGGYRVLLSSIVERKGTPLATADQRDKVLSSLDTAAPAERIRLMDFLRATVAAGTVNTPPAQPGSNGSSATMPAAAGSAPIADADAAAIKKQWEERVTARIHQLVNDPVAAVRGWALLTLVRLDPKTFVDESVRAMLADTDPAVRMLGLVAAQAAADRGAAMAGQLAADPDPIVKAYALAMQRQLADDRVHPTTAPSAN